MVRIRWRPASAISMREEDVLVVGALNGIVTGCVPRLGLGYAVWIEKAVNTVTSVTPAVALRALSLELASVAVIWYQTCAVPAGIVLSSNCVALSPGALIA